MPMTNELIDGLLDLLMKNTAFANIGDAGGLQPSATAGNLYLSLHTADPGPTGNQSTSEVSYTTYARVAVARSGAGWTRVGNVFSPTATINFPPDTAGTATATHGGIGTASSGTGHLLWSGPITPNISIAPGITPQLTTASTITLI